MSEEHLLFLAGYFGVALVTFPVAARTVYHRERHRYKSPIAAYRDAMGVAGGISLFWFIALPACLIASIAMSSVRIAAPAEVKQAVSKHNSLMLESALGIKRDELPKAHSSDNDEVDVDWID